MSYIYIASPYSSLNGDVREDRFIEVLNYTAKLLKDARWCYSPIVHCHTLALRHQLPTTAGYWWAYNRAMLEAASELHILKLSGWDTSVGLEQEFQHWQQVLRRGNWRYINP